jgi:Cytochrome bd terminal oxidase subunit I
MVDVAVRAGGKPGTLHAVRSCWPPGQTRAAQPRCPAVSATGGQPWLAVLVAFVTGAMVVLGVSGWQLLRGGSAAAFTRSAKLSAWVALVCTVLVMVAEHRDTDGEAYPGHHECFRSLLLQLVGQGLGVDAGFRKGGDNLISVSAVGMQELTHLPVVGEGLQGVFGHGVDGQRGC